MPRAAPRRYARSPLVEKQLRELPELGSTEFRDALEVRDRKAPGFVRDEVLVWAIRQLVLNERLSDAQHVATELLERWGRLLVGRSYKWFPHSEQQREDMRQEISARLWKEILDPAESFWEANFWTALTRLCSDVAKSLIEKETPVHLSVLEDIAGDAGLGLPHSPSPEVDALKTENQAEFAAAFAQLPEKIRAAVYLAYVERWKASSSDPNEMTISRALNVSDRTVRTLLRQGEQLLLEWHRKTENEGGMR
jgi:RNA polymerase sigma factor (sigma-70 family)